MKRSGSVAVSQVQRPGQCRGCSAYGDFRDLLKKEKDLGAVVVCTTDNLHAAVSAAAMKKRKHVFRQKPLTHTVDEARASLKSLGKRTW
jgi:predicted dehydrogenase